MKHLKTVLRWLLASTMIYTGAAHFTNPAPFVRIVPRGLPDPDMLVAISGAAEIAGGIGLLVPPLRRPAAWGLIALYVAVFPANVNMAVNHITLGLPIKPWLLWLRLPLQIILIAWAFWFTRQDPQKQDTDLKEADDPAAVN